MKPSTVYGALPYTHLEVIGGGSPKTGCPRYRARGCEGDLDRMPESRGTSSRCELDSVQGPPSKTREDWGWSWSRAGAFYRCFHFDRFNVPPPARATSQNRHEEATFLKDLSVSGGCDTLDLVLAASNNVCAERTRLSKYRINNKKKKNLTFYWTGCRFVWRKEGARQLCF